MHPRLEKIKAVLKLFSQNFYRYIKAAWLPLTLIAIFILQTHLFNTWLNIFPTRYIIRRTIVSGAFGLLFFGPAIFLKKLNRYLYLIIVSLVVGALFVVQFLYYAYSGGFLQVSAFSYLGEGLTVVETAKTFLTYRLLFFIIGPLVVLATFVLEIKGKIVEKILSKKDRLIIGVAMMIFIVFGYSYLFAREYMEAGNTAHIYQYNRLYDTNALVSKLGIMNFSLGDILSAGLGTDQASADDISFAKNWIKENSQNTDNKKDFGLAKGRNLIFIQVESLENSVINEKISGQEITPNLNRLLKDGLYFSNYYTQIGPGTTADAEFSTLNSLYPLPDTVAFIKYAYNDYLALPGLLQTNGYSTHSLHGDVASFWNRANIYPRLGYTKWFSKSDFVVSREIGAYGLGDEDFFTQSLPKLESMPQPFMANLITLSSHTPFKLPADLNTLTIPASTTLKETQQNYLESIHYTDQTIGKFIEALKQKGLYKNSLIVIFGDHGSFTNIGQALKSKTEKTIFSDLQNTQVPLIILAPSTTLRGVNTFPASHIDIYPTIANLLGVTRGNNIMMGQDIITTKNPVMTQRNLISGTIKSILTDKIAYHAGTQGLFEDGICVELPSKKRLPLSACQALYKKESDAIIASDLIVKNNLIKITPEEIK